MADTLPVTFRSAPLPSTWRGTPRELQDAITARLTIETQTELALFVTGSVAPVTNVGPWLKDGVTWYVWDDGSGSYIPEILPQLDAFNTYPFRGDSAGAQNMVFAAPGSASLDVILTETFDPDSVFAPSQFTAPVNGYYNFSAKVGLTVTAGSPTGVTMIAFLKKNGFQIPTELVFSPTSDTLSQARTYVISTNIQLLAGESISLAATVIYTGGGAVTFTISQNDTNLSGFKVKSA